MQRNFFVMLTLSFILLFSGCGGGGSTQQNASSSEALKIEVTLPTQNQKSGVITQKSTSDILSMFLTVLDDTNATVSRTAMVKNGDVWSVSLVINPDEGPFTFRADAYDVAEGSVTASTTPIFAGSSSYNPTLGSLTLISIVLEEVTNGEVTTRSLPYIVSQTSEVDNNETLNLSFNIRNPQGGILVYNFSSYDENGSLCNPSPFSIIENNVTFSSVNQEKTISTSYTKKTTCQNPRHELKLTVQNTQDSVTSIIKIGEGLDVNIILPPNILNIDVVDDTNSFVLDAVVEDANQLNLNYLWTLVTGTATLTNASTKTLTITDYNATNGLSVLLKVTNTDSNASSSLKYIIRASASESNNTSGEKSTVKATGQVQSYESNGTIVTNGTLKDDGFYQAGIAHSFTRGTDIVTDNITGLVWQDNTILNTITVNHANAISYCADLTLAGQTDWRLPTIYELFNVTDDYFNHIDTSSLYWSSTIHPNNSTFIYYIINGTIGNTTETTSRRVRCVRNQ